MIIFSHGISYLLNERYINAPIADISDISIVSGCTILKDDAVLIVIENCYLRSYICKIISRQEIHIFVYEFRLEEITLLFHNKGIISKK